MASRWSRQSAVHHHDDLTAAPRVVDPYESDHLPRDGPLQASWHGPSAHRAFAAAATLFVVAGIGMLGFFAISDLIGPSGEAGSPSDAAAQQEPDPNLGQPGDPGDGAPGLEDVLANATSSAPAP